MKQAKRQASSGHRVTPNAQTKTHIDARGRRHKLTGDGRFNRVFTQTLKDKIYSHEWNGPKRCKKGVDEKRQRGFDSSFKVEGIQKRTPKGKRPCPLPHGNSPG